jgi:hypothetical protein
MEVMGGNGYVEDGPLARLYREFPVNSIWEGSGNVMCLDVLRAFGKFAGSARRAGGRAGARPDSMPLRRLCAAPARQTWRRRRPSTNSARAGWPSGWCSRCRPACCCAMRRKRGRGLRRLAHRARVGGAFGRLPDGRRLRGDPGARAGPYGLKFLSKARQTARGWDNAGYTRGPSRTRPACPQ